MKKSLVFTLCIIFLFLPFYHVNAVIESNDIDWETGTIVRLKGEISSTKLTSDIHTLGLSLTLLSLNESATEIYNIRIDYRIPGHFFQYTPLPKLTTINSTSQANVVFQYDTSWGNCTLDLKLSLYENNTLIEDPNFTKDWKVYFYIATIPTTPTETQTSTTTSNNGFDWGKNWFIFPLIGVGIVLILVIIRISTLFSRRRIE